ncbi:hypothetical protein CSUB01_05097 [Colletotrichum sublineola]|uniref:Uncharacterized protein n=1 Tax=Colletotrichum sublineola TaxID=1173701 RepID=A0A066X8T9_COLSU|nr:hypothetical protein CSUB01_05097 [Colletotrichum sublineola]
MKTKFKADRIPPHRQPVMMAAMTVDKDIYISSSLKGNSFLYTHTNTRLKPEVVRALDRCQSGLQKSTKMPIDKEHRTKAACAEVMADEGITVPRKPKPADIKVPYPFPGFMSNQISIMTPKYYNRD